VKQGLQLRIGQSLTMTPQLQQAIRLLQLSSLELQTEIQQTLDSNPLLDQEDPNQETETEQAEASKESAANETVADANSVQENNSAETLADERSEQTLPEELPVDSRWEDVYYDTAPVGGSGAAGGSEDGMRDFLDNQSGGGDDLREQLRWQLNCSHLTPSDHLIGMALIDGINDDGYLTETLEDIQLSVSNGEAVELDEIEAVLHLIQRFDPVGCGARSPGECMFVQLQQMPPETPLLSKALALVDRYLEYLAGHDYAVLKRRLQINDSELESLIRLIQQTTPRPGHSVSRSADNYVIPDVFVKREQGHWRVELNPDNAPRLRINSLYAGMIRRGDSSEQNSYLKDHLQEARWFIKSLQSRNETLLRVATEIVKRQRAYFEYGEEAMKPMVLRDIAEELEMHESTISRVTTQKYMHTPRGVLEFKFFFSSHVSTADGGECSATAIRALIRKLVAAENTMKPLSDNKIATLLGEQGINVARRTVAKYREAMRIPPSNERKRLI